MAITLTAGDFGGFAQGYGRAGGVVGSAFGSISAQPLAGQTLNYLITGGVNSIAFDGNQSPTLLTSFTVDGNVWAVSSGTYNSGANATEYPITPSGGSFANGVSYSVDMSGGPTYAGPTYVGVSTGNGSASAATINFTSSGRSAGDLLFIAVMTANQAVTISGWTEVATYSPQSRGTAGVAGGVRLTLFSKVSTGSETTVSTSDSGNIQYAAGLVVRGAGGASVAVDIGAGNNVAATTSGSFGGVTTTGDDRLIAIFVATDRDAAAASWGTATNANLANLAERFDNGTSTGTGGGIAIWTGEKQAAGATGSTTSTQAASAAYCWITLALKNATGGGGISGSASGILPLTGAAVGTARVRGTASGILPLTGAAVGTARVRGTASGSLGLSGSSTALARITASAAGSLPLTGSSSARITVAGSAAGLIDLTGLADATVVVFGRASGDLPLTGSAAGMISTPVPIPAARIITPPAQETLLTLEAVDTIIRPVAQPTILAPDAQPVILTPPHRCCVIILAGYEEVDMSSEYFQWPDKLAPAIIFYGIDWARRLGEATIVSHDFELISGNVTLEPRAADGTITSVSIEGGTAGSIAVIIASVVASDGETHAIRVSIDIA